MPNGEFDYQSKITFEFGLFEFTVKNSSGEIVYVRKYGDQLSNLEIEKIAKEEANKHKKMIEDKLKEMNQSK